MGDVELLKSEYWSKSEAFLLPLTGISKASKYQIETFLFWDEYSIENYNLMVKYSYTDYEEFLSYCRKVLFPVWDKNGYVIESYDFGNETVFILDVSEWAWDVQQFLLGKYSKFSKDAKDTIQDYHVFFTKGKAQIDIEIAATLDPVKKHDLLGGLNSIEYVSDYYGLPLPELQKLGEIGGIYNKEKESLTYLSTENYVRLSVK